MRGKERAERGREGCGGWIEPCFFSLLFLNLAGFWPMIINGGDIIEATEQYVLCAS